MTSGELRGLLTRGAVASHPGRRRRPGTAEKTFGCTRTICGVFARGVTEGPLCDDASPPARQQTYIYLADVKLILLRDTLEELTAFGDGGRQPGQFFGVHSAGSRLRERVERIEHAAGVDRRAVHRVRHTDHGNA